MMLKTQRLILRKPKISDWKDLVEGVSPLEVSQYLESVPHPYKKKDALWFIKNSLKKWSKKNKTSYLFFIELKSEKKLLELLVYSIIISSIKPAKQALGLIKTIGERVILQRLKLHLMNLCLIN